MERYPFSLEYKVPAYDTDCYGRLSASSSLRYAQVIAGQHLDALGITYENLVKGGAFFALAAIGARFERAPVIGEKIVISTVPVLSHGAQFLRETVMCDEKGNLLVEFQASWSLVDIKSGRPLRFDRLGGNLPMLSGEWTPFIDPSRLRPPKAEEHCGEHVVRLSDIDVNHHMNNAVYADVMLNCMPDEYLNSQGIDRLMLRYRRQVRLGEKIELYKGFDGQLFSIRGQVDDGCCFEGAFSLKGLET